ncbi:MAG: hypothetical protein KJP23_13170 [Deltaproteobacteria bacterium]|nr:hypothetical protein [Deltaproteobacteria bacterium]
MSRPLRIAYPNAWHHVMNRIYKQFMAQEQDQDLVRVLDGKNPPSMLGSGKFISLIKDRFFKKKKDKEVLASKELAPDLDTIILEVSRYYKVRPTKLKAVRRGMEKIGAKA